MPTPNATRLAALRAGTAGRHIFFKLEHSQGNVLAWDGIGKFVFNGETYEGVAGFASLTGVSNSGDFQNHDIEVRLNTVPRSAMTEIDPRVRGCAATIYAVWIGEGGTVYDSKLIFSGSGNNLRALPGESDSILACRLRAPVADWAFVPRIYYSDVDQQRLYPGDTGCDQVALLENAVIAGWKDGPGNPSIYWRYDNPAAIHDPRAPDLICETEFNSVIGNHTWGPSTYVDADLLKTASRTYTYKDAVTSTDVDADTLGGTISIGGISCYVDSSGDVRTPAGNYVCSSNSLTTAYRLRRAGTISSPGTATATRVYVYFDSPAGFPVVEGNVPTGENMSGFIFENGEAVGGPRTKPGPDLGGGEFYMINSYTAKQYIEDGGPSTHCAVYYAGNGFWYMYNPATGGLTGQLKVSTTGAILGPNGGRIYQKDGSVNNFLRTWT